MTKHLALKGFIFSVLTLIVMAVSPVAFAQSSHSRDGGAPIVVAQVQDGRGYTRRQPLRQQQRGPSLFERQPPPSQGFSLRRLFGLDEPPPSQPAPTVSRPKPRAPSARQERAKPQAANRIVVFGDWLADALSQGLDDIFSDMPNVAIARRTRGDLGLVREDKGNWPKIAADYLNSKQKVSIAVLMLGMMDRAALASGNERLEPLSERWKHIYQARVDALLAVFVNQGIPVVWVGLPPVRDEAASEQYAAINILVRDRVRQAGGAYVDIWAGFVDEDNRYIQMGPDANGEETKLRFNDGLRFTRKGSDKIAHYTAVEIRRLLGSSIDPKEVPTALPGMGNEPFVEIDKTVMPQEGLPDSGAGVVQPLTRTDTSPGGVLLKGRTDLNAAETVRRAFREGNPTTPVPGRMDDYYLKLR